jgi:mannose-6-phosphate isomerase-like protein (cupin superfamily)
MMQVDAYRDGNLHGFLYTFTDTSEGLNPHVHPPEDEHNLIVLEGRVELRYQDRSYELGPGVHKVQGSERHRIWPLEAGTRILNLYTNKIWTQL